MTGSLGTEPSRCFLYTVNALETRLRTASDLSSYLHRFIFVLFQRRSVCAATRSIRPLRQSEAAQQHQALRATRVHHGELRRADAQIPQLRKGTKNQADSFPVESFVFK